MQIMPEEFGRRLQEIIVIAKATARNEHGSLLLQYGDRALVRLWHGSISGLPATLWVRSGAIIDPIGEETLTLVNYRGEFVDGPRSITAEKLGSVANVLVEQYHQHAKRILVAA